MSASGDARRLEPYHARLEALAADVVAYIAKRAAVRAVSADAALLATIAHLQEVASNRQAARAMPTMGALLQAYYEGTR